MTSEKKTIIVHSEPELHALAAEVAALFCPTPSHNLSKLFDQRSIIIYLKGDLGTGKTTWTRGFLRALGFNDKVKSPTFTLVEPYTIRQQKIYHFDLYRLKEPEELEYLGANDYFNEPQSLCIIEWPEYGGKFLPPADLVLQFTYIKNDPGARKVTLTKNISD